MSVSVGVIGAGIVGITSALELADRGFDVTLIDRAAPGRQTSYGNAGVISASTVLTVNNPAIWRQLPRLALNRSNYFRYDPAFALSRWKWLLEFLGHARRRHAWSAAKALRPLQQVSLDKHLALIARAGVTGLLLENGWLKVFRTRRGFESAERERLLMDRLGIPFSILSPKKLAVLEPLLRPGYVAGLLLPECCSVRSPGALAEAYHGLFEDRGGVTLRREVVDVTPGPGNASLVELDGSGAVRVDRLVIAAGPWSPELCRMTGYRIPMAWERGYHVHLEAPEPGLNRPVFDVELGIVLSPQNASVRVTSGVEFAHRDAPPDYRLIRTAIRSARRAGEFGRELDETPWLGSRPTLPDSLPMIGRSPRHAGIWFNFGHQHIGLATSAASAEIIADQIEGKRHATIDSEPFEPGRFRI